MTDVDKYKKIIDGLKNHSERDKASTCTLCPYYKTPVFCSMELCSDALALIYDLRKEIEDLKWQIHDC